MRSDTSERTTRLTTLAREPVFHFLVIAVLLLGVERIRHPPRAPEHLIHVSADDVQRIQEDYRRSTGVPPTAAILAGLVSKLIDEEVLYREALRFSLDRGDALVRRRLIQKIELLAEDAATDVPVTPVEAQAYLDAHRASFEIPSRVSFRHLFFSQAVHGARAQEAATLALTRLRQDPGLAVSSVGDAFPHGPNVVGKTSRDIEALFGSSFARAALEAPIGRWTGPIHSIFGEHLVSVESIVPARAPPLVEVASQVETAILRERAKEGREAFLQGLRARYIIESAAPLPDGVVR